jgi:hypothetical protein
LLLFLFPHLFSFSWFDLFDLLSVASMLGFSSPVFVAFCFGMCLLAYAFFVLYSCTLALGFIPTRCCSLPNFGRPISIGQLVLCFLFGSLPFVDYSLSIVVLCMLYPLLCCVCFIGYCIVDTSTYLYLFL